MLTPANNRLTVLAFVSLLLLALTGCWQLGVPQAEQDVSLELSDIAEQVERVELTVLDANGDTNTYTELNETGESSTFDLTLPLGETTFTARGFDAETGGVVLYKTQPPVTETITSDTTQVELTMKRMTSAVTVTATGVEAGESVRASIGGVMQGLVADGSGSAVGTLEGVPTGSGLEVLAEAYSGTTLTKQGSATLDLSEDDEAVTVALSALGPDNDAPVIRGLSLDPAGAITVGTELTLSVDLFDPDDNLEELSVNWGDGDTTLEPVAADLDGEVDLSHTYSTAGNFSITVTAYDDEGAFDSDSTSVTVNDDEADVGVVIDTGPEVINVTLTALNVPSDTSSITATVTDPNFATADLKETYEVGLVFDPEDFSTWFASLNLPDDTAFTLSFIVTDSDGNEETFGPFPFNSSDGTVENDLGGDGGEPGNQAPVADAGDDQTVTDTNDNGSEDVTLDGSDSSDSDGNIVSYEWSASGVTIPDGATPTASFPVGTTTVTLTVTDDDGATDTDTVEVTVLEPESTEPVIVPLSTTCDETTAVGESCEVSVHLQNFSEEFVGFQFDYELSNDNYSVDINASSLGELTSSWTDAMSETTVAAFSGSATGDGEIYVLALTREATGPATLTTSNGELTNAAIEAVTVPGDTIDLP